MLHAARSFLPPKPSQRDYWPILKQTGTAWVDDKVPKLAAGLTYYTVISLAPLIVITMKAAALFLRGNQDAQADVAKQVSSVTGGTGGSAIKDIIQHAGQPGHGTFATIVSLLVLIFGASGVFIELQDSMNTIWQVKPRPNLGLVEYVRQYFLSFAMVLGIALLLLISATLSFALGLVSNNLLGEVFSSSAVLVQAVGLLSDFLISTGVMFVLFAAIFKVLPDAQIRWRDVVVGAGATALLFQVGKYLLTLYFGMSGTSTMYGAAGSLVALLLWLYYSSQILFLGAEFTKVYAAATGRAIRPSPHAEPVSVYDRAKTGRTPQGISPVAGPASRSATSAPAAFAPRVEPFPFGRPPRARMSPPPRPVFRRLASGSMGLVAGVAAGAAAAYFYAQRHPVPTTPPRLPPPRPSVVRERLDNIEARALRVADVLHRIERHAGSEWPTLKSRARSFIWRHPSLWRMARRAHLDRV